MKTIDMDNVSKEFTALVKGLNQTGEILFVEHNLPVAKLVAVPAPANSVLKAGCLKGFVMSDDFDAPLEEFKEYRCGLPAHAPKFTSPSPEAIAH
jgi:hypothetical protein